MSKSWVQLAGKTVWYHDKSFALWLRVMALNLESYPCHDYAWTQETADDWMNTTRLGPGSNSMGVNLDDDFGSFQQICLLHNVVKRVRETLDQLDNVTMGHVADLLGLEQPCAVDEVQTIARAVDSLLSQRLESIRAETQLRSE